MLRKDLAAELLKHRENDIKIGLHDDTGIPQHYVTIEYVAYDSTQDVIVISGHRTFPEDVADDMQKLVRELHEHLESTAANNEWYDEWRERCADALGIEVEQL
jgi:hypothetical protein